ncbi:Kinesin-like protein KIF20A [Acipenser ruthenus]|uniref:Kinesin-like protein n=1 Tax=Acipenser ruthenus TaxID=7906 RepID=A0A444UWR6_ACIRT|nr:Kinesin-like protein KIF20A [Acipenser ruthenus]
MEERYENKIQNLQESLKKYYKQEIQERDERIEELMAVLQDPSKESKLEQSFLDGSQTLHESPCGVRRSKRIASSALDLKKTNAELELVKTELQEKNKDLNWINVSSAEDAWKVLKVGRKNQSFASTNLNHCSSRSHSIFSIRILHINGDPESDLAPKISELSLCDLAGSERCKEQKSGDRMKEANNINTSLHTLGRCIAALRQNQQHKTKQNMVPFRDSKLTRAFQGFFCGRGKSCMIVNINQCASMYDETLQALKFSAIATQLVHAPPSKTRVAYIQSLLREHGMRTNDSLSEEEGQGEESDDEGDVTVFDTDVS